MLNSRYKFCFGLCTCVWEIVPLSSELIHSIIYK